MKLTVKTSMGDYNIIIERGSINSLPEYCNTDKKALIVTDSGVPFEYAEAVSKQFKKVVIKVIPQGEKSKSFDTYKQLLEVLNEMLLAEQTALLQLVAVLLATFQVLLLQPICEELIFIIFQQPCFHRWILPLAEKPQ